MVETLILSRGQGEGNAGSEAHKVAVFQIYRFSQAGQF